MPARANRRPKYVEKTLAVNEIYWCHDRIKIQFSDGRLLVSTLVALQKEELQVRDLPSFDIALVDDRWYAVTGNRRLWVLREFQTMSANTIFVKARLAPDTWLTTDWWRRRWTTMNSGTSVEFEIKRGGDFFQSMSQAITAAGLRGLLDGSATCTYAFLQSTFRKLEALEESKESASGAAAAWDAERAELQQKITNLEAEKESDKDVYDARLSLLQREVSIRNAQILLLENEAKERKNHVNVQNARISELEAELKRIADIVQAASFQHQQYLKAARGLHAAVSASQHPTAYEQVSTIPTGLENLVSRVKSLAESTVQTAAETHALAVATWVNQFGLGAVHDGSSDGLTSMLWTDAMEQDVAMGVPCINSVRDCLGDGDKHQPTHNLVGDINDQQDQIVAVAASFNHPVADCSSTMDDERPTRHSIGAEVPLALPIQELETCRRSCTAERLLNRSDFKAYKDETLNDLYQLVRTAVEHMHQEELMGVACSGPEYIRFAYGRDVSKADFNVVCSSIVDIVGIEPRLALDRQSATLFEPNLHAQLLKQPVPDDSLLYVACWLEQKHYCWRKPQNWTKIERLEGANMFRLHSGWHMTLGRALAALEWGWLRRRRAKVDLQLPVCARPGEKYIATMPGLCACLIALLSRNGGPIALDVLKHTFRQVFAVELDASVFGYETLTQLLEDPALADSVRVFRKSPCEGGYLSSVMEQSLLVEIPIPEGSFKEF